MSCCSPAISHSNAHKFIAFLCMAGADLAQDLSLGSHHGCLSMSAVQTGFHRGKEIDLNYELGKIPWATWVLELNCTSLSLPTMTGHGLCLVLDSSFHVLSALLQFGRRVCGVANLSGVSFFQCPAVLTKKVPCKILPVGLEEIMLQMAAPRCAALLPSLQHGSRMQI